jgi:cysteinyl-tRNA synthetase
MASASSTAQHADPLQGGVVLAEGLSSTGLKCDKHPLWYPPSNKDGHGLRVLNSLTETVEPFAPKNGRKIKWYTCGPTVYDVSHMGHARAYLTFDILRRIMEDYFGYSVQYQMNITDIDDKIIKRARINKLLEDFKLDVQSSKDSFATLDEVVANAKAFGEEALNKRKAQFAVPLPEKCSSRIREEREEKMKELDLKLEQFAAAAAGIAEARASRNEQALYKAAVSLIGDWLDAQKGGTVNDREIFEKHARFYERTFLEDMQRLGVREADVLTRVTEYVPQVVAYIEKIMANGFAYKGETSVFFDTEAYIKSGHSYPKLKPGGDKNTTDDEMAEGEGALTKNVEGEKKSPNDFALWKFSKPGEPQWDSPWGVGRPGWHIECSVMASDILGDNMDIHAGGWDLKFPHHDNECAQAEAHTCTHQWVNYFFHCGHLHIKGLKMSKSLKNFITIRQALDELGVTAREMRVLFLMFHWAKNMNFSDQSIDSARERMRQLRSFFGSVEILLRSDYWGAVQGFDKDDRNLAEKCSEVEGKVHAALCDNFDTPVAFDEIMSLVSATNAYLLLEGHRPSGTLVRKVGRYITRMLRIFGIVEGSDVIGFSSGSSGDGGASEGERRLALVVDSLVKFRDDVRQAAREKQPPQVFLPLCDLLRDELLPPAGIRLEDKPNGPTTWKNDDPATLLREVCERKAAIENDRKKALTNQRATKQKLLEKWEQFVASPVEYFKGEKEKYSAFDESGIPTTDAAGAAVPEKTQSKLRKEQQKYQSAHDELQTKGGVAWLASIRKEIADIDATLKPQQ